MRILKRTLCLSYIHFPRLFIKANKHKYELRKIRLGIMAVDMNNINQRPILQYFIARKFRPQKTGTYEAAAI